MKNKIIKVLVLSFVVLSLTGCTKILKDEDNKPVKNEITGQNLTENILCQPTNKESIKKYDEHNIDYKKLPKCDEMEIGSGNYEGVWNSIFVKPLAFVLIKIGELLNNYGLAVIIVTILIRLVMFPLTKKTAMQSENMKNAKPELEKLEKKYKDKNDQASMMAKSQEMMAIYKKYDISPLSGCLFSFIQIPLFFAFYESLNRLPALFEGNFLGLNLGTTPSTGLSNGSFTYIILIVLVVATTFISTKLNQTASMSSEQEKQMKTMMNMMIVVIFIASFNVATSIALYWITNSTCTIIQNLLVKKRRNV